MTSDRSWQAELRQCYEEYVSEIAALDSYVSKSQLLFERFRQLELDAVQSIKDQQFQEDNEVYNQLQSNNASKKGKKKKRKNKKKKKKKSNNQKNGSLEKASADVESSSSDGEDGGNVNDCTTGIILPSAVVVGSAPSTDCSSNSKASAQPTTNGATTYGGDFSQDIENIRATIPGLVKAWKSGAKNRLISLWRTAPRTRKEAILRQACPLLVHSIDDQFIIVNGNNKVYPQSSQQGIILTLESRLTIDNLVNELPELLDEVMDQFSWYAASLVTFAREIAVTSSSIFKHGNTIIPIGTDMVAVGPELEQFGLLFKVHTPFDSDVLVQHGLVSSADEFQPVLLVLNTLLQLQVGVLNQL